MKKLILSLILGMMLISFASALEFDNIKTYDPILNEVTITNCNVWIGTCLVQGDLIAKAKLITPQINYVMPGSNRKVAEFDIDLTSDTYNDVLKQIDLINNNDGKEITRQIDYKYKTLEPYTVDVNDYKEVCEEDIKNGSMVCTQEVIGKHSETRYNEIWTPLAKLDLVKGKITIGLFADVYAEDNVEWIPTLFGTRINEWATWTSSFNVGLFRYYDMNSTRELVSGIYNLTIYSGTPVYNSSALIGNASQLIAPTGQNSLLLGGNSTDTALNWTGKDITLNLWVKLWAVGADERFLGACDDEACAAGVSFEATNNPAYKWYGNGKLFPGAAMGVSVPERDVWYMVTMIWNGSTGLNGTGTSTLQIYINNTYIGGGSVANQYLNSIKMNFGRMMPNNLGSSTSIDEIGIWNRTLTPTEITDLYNDGAGMTYILEASASGTSFGLCNASLTTPYLNITAKDEVSLANINFSIYSSTFTYSNGTDDLVYSFSNLTANPSYSFCVSTAEDNISINSSIVLSATDYPQKTFSYSETLTNETTNKTFYLLNVADGVYQTFNVQNIYGSPISEATITASNTNVGLVGTGTTDSGGTVQLWLNPNIAHTILTVASGYPNDTRIVNPTSGGVTTITLGSANSTTVPAVDPGIIQGIGYMIYPQESLFNNTQYTFRFVLSNTYYTINYYGFTLYNSTNDVVGTANGAGNSGTASYVLNVGNNTMIKMIANWTANGTTETRDYTWRITNTANTQYSIWAFKNRLVSYLEPPGIFGLTIGSVSLNLVCFIIIFLMTGIFAYKFGMDDPKIILLILFIIVTFFEYGLGILDIGKLKATWVVGIITAFIFIREAYT